MVHIQWKDRYNINFREIDAQHRGLLDLVNDLSDLQGQDSEPEQVSSIIHNLCHYALEHFSTEERYLQAANYPGLAQQRQDHQFFVNRLLELSQDDQPDSDLAEAVYQFAKTWYLDHILESDRAYAAFLKKALPGTPIEAVLFGLDGVVCIRDLGPLLRDLADRSGQTEPEVQAYLMGNSGLLGQLETGTLEYEAFFAELTRWAGSPCPEAELTLLYCAGFHPVPALLNLVKRLMVSQPVALVGDAAPCLRTQGLNLLGMEGLFRAESFSCELGVRLPDAKLCLDAAARLGLAPESCLLVHPSTACLEAAQAVHLQTLQYTNPVTLMGELRRLGLLF